MILIAIVEDDPKEQEILQSLLRTYAQDRGTVFSAEVFSDGMDFLEKFACQYDLIFLDIQMKHVDGLSTAQRIREIDRSVLLYFVTGFAQHAADGYEVDASGFILKPVSAAVFFRQMDRAMQRFRSSGQQYLVLQNSREMHRVPVSEISYIESMGHYIKVHLKKNGGKEGRNSSIVALSSLKSAEMKLEGLHFFRCSNSVIVNLAYVESVTGNKVCTGGEVLTVSRTRKKDLMVALNRYFSESDY